MKDLPSIVSFGEVLWDVYPGERHLGGAALNLAAHFALQGGRAHLFSAVGRDASGDEILARLAAWGVETDLMRRREDLPTGTVKVTLDGDGQPSYRIEENVAWDRIEPAPRGETHDALCFGSLALRRPENRETLERLLLDNTFREIFVDVNLRPPFVAEENVLPGLEHATILKISEEELPLLSRVVFGEESVTTGQLAGAFRNLREILVTRGGRGAEWYDCRRGETVSCPARPVRAVSAVGAGDSFSAVYLHRRLIGRPPEAALQAAVTVAGFVVSRAAAVPDGVPRPL